MLTCDFCKKPAPGIDVNRCVVVIRHPFHSPDRTYAEGPGIPVDLCDECRKVFQDNIAALVEAARREPNPYAATHTVWEKRGERQWNAAP